jgi:hypothetical protein
MNFIHELYVHVRNEVEMWRTYFSFDAQAQWRQSAGGVARLMDRQAKSSRGMKSKPIESCRSIALSDFFRLTDNTNISWGRVLYSIVDFPVQLRTPPH